MKRLALLLTALSSPALAQSSTSAPWFMPDPVAWYRRTSNVITQNGLDTQVETLAYALVFTLFAYGALRAAYYARNAELSALFGRLLLAAALLLSLTPLRSTLHSTWVAAFGWSSGLFADVETELVEASDGVTLLLAPFFATGAIVNYAGKRLARESVQAGAQVLAAGTSSLAGRATSYMNGVLLLFFPLFGVYAALVYASGFVVLLSMLLLPLAAALLMLPSGASWMSRWLGMYLAALFTVMFLPIVFGIAVDLGMVQPLERMGGHMRDALDQFSLAAESLALPAGAEVWRVAEWQAWLENVPYSVLNALGGVVSILLGWLLSLVALVVGMLVGVYLLLNLPGLVGGFVGGIGGTAMAAAALARPRTGSRVERTVHTTNQLNAVVTTKGTNQPALAAPPPGGGRNT